MASPIRRGPYEDELRAILKSPGGVLDAEDLKDRLGLLTDAMVAAESWDANSSESFGTALRAFLSARIDRLDVDDLAGEQDGRRGDVRLALKIDFAIQPVSLKSHESPVAGRVRAAAAAACVSEATYYHDRRTPVAKPGRRTQAIRRIAEQLGPDEPAGRRELAVETALRVGPGPASRKKYPLQPALPVGDIQEEFFPAHLDDLSHGFWWRNSTERYLDAIAGRVDHMVPITVYAGADGPSDVGPPIHREMLEAVIATMVKGDPVLGGLATAVEQEGSSIRAIAEMTADACGDAYLGSIARELARALPYRTAMTPSDSDDRLRSAVQSAILDRTTSEFAARAVALLAFALRHAGNSVSVLGAYYDPDLLHAEASIRTENPSFGSYGFRECLLWNDRERATSRQIPLFHLVGRSEPGTSGGLVVGETSIIADARTGAGGTRAPARLDLLQQAFVESTVLVVGSSVTDPGVLAALAATKGNRVPHYALILPPRIGEDGTAKRCLARNLIAQRFLHCGIVPILADFPMQIAQFLRELAFRVHAGVDYIPYSERCARWWRQFGPLWGLNSGQCPTEKWAVAFQEAMKKALIRIRELVDRSLKDYAAKAYTGARQVSETIIVELWIRNPDDRNLFRFATTNGKQPPGSRRDVLRLDDRSPEHIIPATFQQGYVQTADPNDTQSEHTQAGSDEFIVGIPVVFDEAPWHHLPVGVVCLKSNESNGYLRSMCKNAKESASVQRLVLGGVREAIQPPETP